jgi:hypothetical protein
MERTWRTDVPYPFLLAFTVFLVIAGGLLAGDSPLLLGAGLVANGLVLAWSAALYLEPDRRGAALDRRARARSKRFVGSREHELARWAGARYRRAMRVCQALGIAAIAAGIALLVASFAAWTIALEPQARFGFRGRSCLTELQRPGSTR